jgi:hypothetical protein
MRAPLAGVLVLLAALPAATAAQGSGAIQGRVLDEATDVPIPAALVQLVSETGRTVQRAVADSAGRFALPVRLAGRYRLRATGLGYTESLTAAFDVDARDTLNVIVRMGIEAVRLPALEVVARSRVEHIHPGLASFYYRMNRGIGGTFITREQIELRNPTYTSDLLRDAGIEVFEEGRRRGRVVTGRMQCTPAIYLDGNRLDAGDNALADKVNLVHPSSIEGIEVYRGAATLPPEFGGSTGQCGAIAIWLRRGT